jgi:hypothetical protein
MSVFFEIFLKFWRGQYSLGRTFWIGLVIGFFIVNFATNSLYRALFEQGYGTRGFLMALMIKWPYVAVAMIAVWRAARPNVSSLAWTGWGARIIVVLIAGNIGMFLLNGGAVNLVRNVLADVPGQMELVDEWGAARMERKNASVQPATARSP